MFDQGTPSPAQVATLLAAGTIASILASPLTILGFVGWWVVDKVRK